MPYTLRKAPNRDLYWVVNKETKKKYSKEPLPYERAIAQMRALYASERSELRGGAISKALLAAIAQSAYSGKTRKEIANFTLIFATPTAKFYKQNNGNLIIVSLRGTKLNDGDDIAADIAAFRGMLRDTERYRKDRDAVLRVQSVFPRPPYRYIAVAHSLGGAVLDLLLRDGLIQNGMSYNPLVEPQELGGNPLHHRIYHKDDPLLALFGHKIPGIEIRTTKEPIWKYYLKHYLPFPLGDLFQYYDRHKIRIFKGGSTRAAFEAQLKEVGMSPDDYLEVVRENARRCGYDPEAIEFSDNKTHKIQIRTPEGRIVRFGRVGYNDFHIWTHLERNNQVAKGTAKSKRERFWKSHIKMGGDWKGDNFSPNWLALRLLW